MYLTREFKTHKTKTKLKGGKYKTTIINGDFDTSLNSWHKQTKKKKREQNKKKKSQNEEIWIILSINLISWSFSEPNEKSIVLKPFNKWYNVANTLGGSLTSFLLCPPFFSPQGTTFLGIGTQFSGA
jgi:hypothetical protein